jgi:RNA polymerase sigma factor (sigma-70 family)
MGDWRTDSELIGVSIGEPTAFMAFFERHLPTIARYLGRRLSWTVAEDLTAEVFAIAFASRHRYDGRPDALPWLYGIAANLLRARARMEERELALLARTGIDPVTASLEPHGDFKRALDPRIAEALLGLSVDEREVLLLVAWADLSYEQIAQSLDVPVGTVKSRLSRARSLLRRSLTADDIVEEVSHG